MIVKTGRQLITQNTLTSISSHFELYLEKSVGDDISYMTTPGLTYNDIISKTNYGGSLKIAESGIADTDTVFNDHLTKTWDSDKLTLTFSGTVIGVDNNDGNENTGTYGAAYIIYNPDPEDTSKIVLFSRVTFKETTITAGSKYNLNYVIYF